MMTTKIFKDSPSMEKTVKTIEAIIAAILMVGAIIYIAFGTVLLYDSSHVISLPCYCKVVGYDHYTILLGGTDIDSILLCKCQNMTLTHEIDEVYPLNTTFKCKLEIGALGIKCIKSCTIVDQK